MKKEEAILKKQALKKDMEELFPEILKEILRVDKYIGDDYIRFIMETLTDRANKYSIASFGDVFRWAASLYEYSYPENELNGATSEEIEAYEANRREEYNRETSRLKEMCAHYEKIKYEVAFGIDKKIDLEKEFDGDIIITDPCYFIKDEDWYKYGYGENLNKLGFTQYMTRNNMYGDWSCTVYDQNTRDKIGTFCADAGLVGVYLLDEVMAYNPDYKDVKENHWSVTCVRDFKGIVEFKVVHEEGIYETESSYHNAGEKWETDSVEVHGHGINKVTGEPIDFIGRQTGF